MIDYLTRVRGFTLISIFYQDDALGLYSVGLLHDVLVQVGLHYLSIGSHASNSVNVTAGVAQLLAEAQPLVPEAS